MLNFRTILALTVSFCFLALLPAQTPGGWQQFLRGENANFYDICHRADQYFEKQKAEAAKEEEPETGMEEEGSEYNQYMRWKWFWSNRVNDDGSFPDVRNLPQLRPDRLAAGNAASRSAGDPCQWELISQTTCEGFYHGIGQTNGVAFHPTDPKTYYVTAPHSGVWKTTDGGDTYTPISEGLPYNGASNLVVDYNNPNTLYVSNTSGDYYNGYNNCSGLYKSTDGGAHWLPTPLSWSLQQNVAIYKIVIHPQNPAVLLVASTVGLYRTDDGGNTWTVVRGGSYTDVEFRSGDGTTAYAAGNSSNSQIFKSADAGLTWAQTSSFNFGNCWILLSVTPANPDMLAAVCIVNSARKVYVSTDNGANLTYRSDCPEADIFFVSPNDPNVLYCGYTNVHRSTDQGLTWNQFTSWSGGGLPPIHADEHNVAYQPGTKQLYFCNDGGVYRYDENSGVWKERSDGLPITQFYHIAVAQTDDIFMIGGTQDNGGRKRIGPGEWAATNGGDAMEVAIDYTNADILYTTYIYGQLYRSLDGWGVNHDRISDHLPGQTANHDLNGSWVAPYQIDPTNPTVLVLGYADVYRTTNRGNTWTQISTNLTGDPNQKLDQLAIAPSNGNVIYASNGKTMYKTTNLGANWSSFAPPANPGISCIAVHPKNPDIVYITRGGYNAGNKVFRSDNGGSTWTNISGSLPNIPTNCIYIDQATDNSYTLFVGNDLGVWYRTEAMSDWAGMNEGLPATIVTDIDLQKATRKLRAGTYGRGIWEWDLGHLPGQKLDLCPDLNHAHICLPEQRAVILNASAWQGLSGPIQLSAAGLPNGASVHFSAPEITPGGSVIATFDFPAGLPEGGYLARIYGAADGDTAIAQVLMTVVSNNFSALRVLQPVDGDASASRWPLLRWNGVADANQYELQLASSPAFDAASIVQTQTNIKPDSFQVSDALDEGRVYYWRVRPLNECGPGPWSEPGVFATAYKSCAALEATDLPKNITANGTPTVESQITVTNGGPIAEIKVKAFEGNHTFFKDLTASLVGPSGKEVILFDKKCGGYSGNFKLGFDDAAPQAFGCPPPQTGNLYRPEGKLGDFNGLDANGAWTLRVKDNTISSGGQITVFQLEFCSNKALNPPVIVHNQPLQVAPGSNAGISPDLLLAEDPNTPANQLVFTLITAPRNGHLERYWSGALKPGDQFTQTDLDNGGIRYFDYGGNQPEDTFRFSVTDGEGGLVSDTFRIQPFPLGSTEPANNLSFGLAPNPATQTLRLSLPDVLPADARVQLLSLTGQALRSWTLPAGAAALTLEVGDLPAGMYLVSLQSGKGTGVKRVSKL